MLFNVGIILKKFIKKMERKEIVCAITRLVAKDYQ